MDQYTRYLTRFAAVFVAVAGFVVLTNFIVDPVDIYGVVKVGRFNAIKPRLGNYRILWKAAYLEKYHPSLVFLGSSRVEYGINPVSAVAQTVIPRNVSRFNAAISGAKMYGVFRYLQHLDQVGMKNGTIVIGIDYLMFHDDIQNTELFLPFESVLATTAEGSPQPLHGFDRVFRTLATLSAFDDSIQTLKQQKEQYADFSAEGQSLNDKLDRKILKKKKPRNFFLTEETTWIDTFTRLEPQNFAYAKGMDYLHKTLELARNNNNRVILYISPGHANLQYLEGEYDTEHHLDAWKRSVLAEVERENLSAPVAMPIELWDFTVVNDLLSERLPAEGSSTFMQWYLDPSHYRDNVGDMILQVILGGKTVHTPGGETFGYRLTHDNIDQVIAQFHAAITQWQIDYHDEYAGLQVRINECLNYRQRTGMVCHR